MDGNTRENISVNVYLGNGSVFSVDLNKFNKGQVTFGKHPKNDIVINSPVISDYHGYFQLTNVGWVVYNAQSQNGLIIDGNLRNDGKLQSGMHIRIEDKQNSLTPGVSIFVEIKTEFVSAEVSSVEAEDAEKQAPAKKKSKAPVIVAVILVCVFVIFGGIALVIGLVGFGVFKYFQPVEAPEYEDSDVYTSDYYDYEYDDTYTEEETTEEAGFMPERVPSDESCEQLLLAKCNGTDAVITLYEKDGNGWVERMSANAKIGKNGITYDKQEGDGCTPAGEFDLTFYCGLYSTASNLDFENIYQNSVWVDDADSDYYNTLQTNDNYYKDWDSAEPMYDSYFKNNRHNYCINIDANGDGLTPGDAVPGNGSVITLCGKNDTLTATHGCIDMSGADMTELLGYLDSSKNPEIIIY